MSGVRYKDGRRGLEVEPARKHRKNASVNFPDFGEEKDDFLWLSSDCSSPSMPSFFDDSQQDPLWNLKGGSSSSSTSTSGACSESGDSCFTPSSLCESSSWTTLSTQDAATTTIGDLDIWVSSLDLDVEDSDELVAQCGEQGFDVFGSDFPSPSVRSSEPIYTRTFAIPNFLVCRFAKEAPDCDSSEAIFWPFDQKSYVHHDFEKNFLCLSPRKDVRNVGAEVVERSTSISPAPESSYRRSCNPQKSRTPSTAAAGGFRTRTAPPPRQSRLYRASSDKHDCTVSRKEKLLLQLDAKAQGQSSVSEPLLDLDMDMDVFFRSFVEQGAEIETLVGLSEFDGHEGIGVDDDDELVLD